MLSPAIVWFIIGIAFLGLSKVVTKVNFTYTAYAALFVGVCVAVGIMGRSEYPAANLVAQIIVFFIAIPTIWYLLRERPEEKMNEEKKEYYKSIIGRVAEVAEGGLNSVSGGEVILDGSFRDAKLHSTAGVDSVDAGTKMLIKEVQGDTLIVTVKK